MGLRIGTDGFRIAGTVGRVGAWNAQWFAGAGAVDPSAPTNGRLKTATRMAMGMYRSMGGLGGERGRRPDFGWVLVGASRLGHNGPDRIGD
jgi:hypothetical protein